MRSHVSGCLCRDLLVADEPVIALPVPPDVCAIGSCRACQLAARGSLALGRDRHSPSHAASYGHTASVWAGSQQLRQGLPGRGRVCHSRPHSYLFFSRLLCKGPSNSKNQKTEDKERQHPLENGNSCVPCAYHARAGTNLTVDWIWCEEPRDPQIDPASWPERPHMWTLG